MNHFHVTAGIARGRAHAIDGLPCQDALAYAYTDDGGFVAAVADGAGSRPHSRAGADHAVTAATVHLLDLLGRDAEALSPERWRRTARTVLQETRRCLVEKAGRLGFQPSDLACTLLLLAARDETAAAAQVGDGLVIMRTSHDASYSLLTCPQRGDFANITTFLTSDGALDGASYAVHQGSVEEIAVATDGLDHQLLDARTRAVRADFLEPLFQYHRRTADAPVSRDRLTPFLTSERVQRTTLDDLSLLLATPPIS